MFRIKFTVTYTQKYSKSYTILYYTVEDKEGNLLDIDVNTALKHVDKLDNLKYEDIVNKGIIGHHVDIRGTLDSFSPNCVRKVVYGYNDLETWCLKHNRQLLEEYRGETSPREVSHGQLLNVNWQCSKCGKIFESIIKNRTGKGYGCKNCSKQGDSFPQYYTYCTLQSVFSDILYKYNYTPNDKRYEVDMFIPREMLAIEYDGIAWHNTEDSLRREIAKEKALNNLGIKLLRIVENNIDSIDYANNIIYYVRDIKCENLYALLAEYIQSIYGVTPKKPDYTKLVSEYSTKKPDKSLQSEYPNIAKHWNTELNGVSAEYITPKSPRFGWFTCDKCGTTVNKQVHTMTRRDDIFRCAICDGKTIIPGKNDLFTVRNDLMHLWDWTENDKHKLNPHSLSPKTHKECYWKCSSCGYTWQMSMPSMWGKKFCNNCGTRISSDKLTF